MIYNCLEGNKQGLSELTPIWTTASYRRSTCSGIDQGTISYSWNEFATVQAQVSGWNLGRRVFMVQQLTGEANSPAMEWYFWIARVVVIIHEEVGSQPFSVS